MGFHAKNVTIHQSNRRVVGVTHRAALSVIASKTGCISVGELAMTPKISLVAVCCSRASARSRLRSCSSLNSRTFSIAMIA